MQAEAGSAQVLPLIRGAEPLPAIGGHRLDRQVLAANRIVGFEHDEGIHPFLVMRSRLMKQVKATGQRIFAITSVQPGNGKTHVTLNLAAVLSRIHPTVLVELDMRWPTTRQRLGLPCDHPGVDDYLRGEADLQESRLAIDGYRLSIHSARQRQHKAETLLASHRLSELFDDLRHHADAPICLVDTPPALVNDDLTLILNNVDAVLIVVEEAQTRSKGLVDAMTAISPTPIVGAILNKSISSTPVTPDYGYYNRLGDD